MYLSIYVSIYLSIHLSIYLSDRAGVKRFVFGVSVSLIGISRNFGGRNDGSSAKHLLLPVESAQGNSYGPLLDA